MPEEPTTPDLVELVSSWVEAGNGGRGVEGWMTPWAPNAVWDLSPSGLGTFEGDAAIRRFLEDWLQSYEKHRLELVEVRDLGNGVSLAVNRLVARPLGSTGDVQLLQAWVSVWDRRKVVRQMSYLDIDEGRAAAERLADSRG